MAGTKDEKLVEIHKNAYAKANGKNDEITFDAYVKVSGKDKKVPVTTLNNNKMESHFVFDKAPVSNASTASGDGE